MLTMILAQFLFLALLVVLSAEGSSGQCDVSKYRKVTGACNNVRVALQGAANNPYRRVLPENTKDDFHVKHIDLRIPQGHHPHVSALLGVWGQLLQRDLDRPVYDQTNDDLSQVVNSASGYLDASPIYGNSRQDEDRIRVEGGLLNLRACTECAKQDSGRGALISMFILEHNRLVDQFSRLNPHWSHEQLFQEAKRAVIAEIQHITYNEFLPVLLGEAVTTEYSLHPQKFGRFEGYASSNAPGISYALSITALKVLSSLTPTSLMSQQGNSDVKTHDIESQLSEIFTKIVRTPADKPGHHLDYEPQDANLDTLLAQSHSARLAKYQAWLQMCRNDSTFVHYSDFYAISDEEREYLAKVYKNAADVDLLIGGILEHSQNGSILGPTFTCMLAVQFNDLRKSDRFWYENDIPPTSFTHDQLNELRKVKFSGLLCANVPSIISIQPFAFVQPDPYLNAPIGCDHHDVFDPSAWRETTKETIKTMISIEMLQEAIRKAEDNVLRRQQTEFLLWSHKGGVDPKSPAGTAAAFSKPVKQALLLANNSILLEYASNEILNSLTEKVQKLRRRRQLDSGDNVIGFGSELSGKEFLSELDVSSFLPNLQSQSANSDEDCTEENGPCDPRSPYRTFNGHCNNPERPHLGKSLTTFARLLPAVYENGISSPRQTSVTGVPLPSPRLVSAMVHADISHLHNRYTLMVMQFAQFVDHDLTFTPVHRGFFASIPDCRSCDSPLTVHPECMPIPIPNNDPFYPQVNITSGERFCLPFMRSLPGQQRLGARAQVNQNTAYLDGSQIYGQNACQARSLRAYGGRLNVTVRHNGDKDLLPLSPVHPECKAPSGYCFIAGDGRASEQAALTAIHTIYLREHNRVVLGLRGVNPHWGDEKLYQTARRITVAAYQHITYNEFLPRLLGWGAVDLYGLRLTSQGYYKGYSSSCNPNIVTEFAVAAYRIGHSLLRPHLPRMSANYQAVNPAILLRDVFFNPDVINQRYMIDEIIRGLVSTPMEDLDQFITGEITNHLFEERRIPHSGMDLPALNVQRGRDHAIPSYNDYRTLCGMKRATNWEDLNRELPSEVIARLRRIYPSVNDIDLFPAGLSERAVQGGLVGPTFACIIGLQFRQLRQCDRFWYESGDPIVRFTEPQLAEIRKATLAKSLCDNLDVSGDIQRSVFDQPTDFGNPRLPCRSLPTMDFSVWRENAEQGCQIAGRIVPVGDTALPSPCTSCVCTNEGAQCASLRVTDCSQLLREAGRDAILRDEVCAAQCANLLLSSPGPTLEALEDIVSLTTKRPAQTPHSGRSREFLPTSLIPPPPPQAQTSVRRPSIRSFKLPDIAAAVFG